MLLTNAIIYVFLFVSLFYEVFLLITYFENREKIQSENRLATSDMLASITHFPTVTIFVPCWNEEMTLGKTVNSLVNLNYPKDKLKIMIIDDGSTDDTWSVAQTFAHIPQVEIHRKENGGKHTALNYGLARTTSDLVGCLDADSYVDSNALLHIVYHFQNDPEAMAVTPSVQIWKAKSVIQLIQKVEYGWGIFVRKMLSYLGAMYVTPGPFSIFRREVFVNLGGYRHAHQTEDMEIALRLQSNHYKMINAHNAHVFTVAPENLKKLYKQRLRWTYGFIKNALDYKHLFFKSEFGNLGFFVLPMASISISSAIYVVVMMIASFFQRISTIFLKIQTVGWYFNAKDWFHFNWFYVPTEVIAIMTVMAFIGTLSILYISRKMAEGKVRMGVDILYFLTIYTLIAPLWLSKAVWNAVFSVKTTWR